MIWSTTDPQRLPPRVREACRDGTNQLVLSVVSINGCPAGFLRARRCSSSRRGLPTPGAVGLPAAGATESPGTFATVSEVATRHVVSVVKDGAAVPASSAAAGLPGLAAELLL